MHHVLKNSRHGRGPNSGNDVCISNFPSTCSERCLLDGIKEIIITSALTRQLLQISPTLYPFLHTKPLQLHWPERCICARIRPPPPERRIGAAVIQQIWYPELNHTRTSRIKAHTTLVQLCSSKTQRVWLGGGDLEGEGVPRSGVLLKFLAGAARISAIAGDGAWITGCDVAVGVFGSS
jgi:hypothetical protein